MVQIPDSAKPYVDGFLKYHFWIVAAIVPFVLLPSVFSANGGLRQKVQSQKSTIDGHKSVLEGIKNDPAHPNNAWVEDVDARTKKLRAEILEQWRRFWTGQQSLRVWPQELGDDFLAAISAVEAGQQEKLPANLLQRYQNSIPEIVRHLPGRMGCKDLMQDDAAKTAEGSGDSDATGDLESPEASLTQVPLVWSGEDQERLMATFVWNQEPTTVQVRLAQEELWVYGIFCDAIRKLNEGATGAFNATITSVQDLAVGYPAAEEAAGGQGGSRIMWKASPQAGAATGEGDAAMAGLAATTPTGRPSNARFSDSGATSVSSVPAMPTEGVPGAEGVPGGTVSADDPFYEWIYVDFEGRPLNTAALKASQDATMVHLVPFVLRVVMDQRKVPGLIEEFAQNPIPIDVRQVRINVGEQGSGGGASSPLSSPVASGDAREDAGGRRRRPYDVTVEVRGTVGLATPPDEKPLGGGQAPAEGVPGVAQ